MRKIKKILFYGVLCFCNFLLFCKNIDLSKKYNFNCPEKKIVIVIPSYNNEEWLVKNLDFVRNQNYQNFSVIYINDCSTDKTGQMVASYIEKHNLQDKFILINNEKNMGSLANIYKAVYMCENDTIIAMVDGDDWLAHNNVLKIINSVYQNKNVWLTYGQYKEVPGDKILYCVQYSREHIRNNSFRKRSMHTSHLKTFYAGLFKLIKLEDLLYEGQFYPTTGDRAMMMPMIEMAGDRFKCIRDILYIYNCYNPINVHKINKKLQRFLNYKIRDKIPYKPVSWEDVMNA